MYMFNITELSSIYLLRVRVIAFLLLISNFSNAFEERIRVEPNYIFVKYEHQLKGIPNSYILITFSQSVHKSQTTNLSYLNLP